MYPLVLTAHTHSVCGFYFSLFLYSSQRRARAPPPPHPASQSEKKGGLRQRACEPSRVARSHHASRYCFCFVHAQLRYTSTCEFSKVAGNPPCISLLLLPCPSAGALAHSERSCSHVCSSVRKGQIARPTQGVEHANRSGRFRVFCSDINGIFEWGNLTKHVA